MTGPSAQLDIATLLLFVFGSLGYVMPPKIRAMLTLIVVLTAIALWLGRSQIALAASPILYFGLTLAICGAIWMFPETKKSDS